MDNFFNLGVKAKKASLQMSLINNEQKNNALMQLKKNLNIFSNEIIKENFKDIEKAKKNNLSSALIDRLTLNPERIENIIRIIEKI